MGKTLADILGWEEGATYKFGELYYSVVGENLYYFKDFESSRIKTNQSTIIDLLELANEAERVEPKKYYLKHKYLTRVGIPQDLFLAKNGKDDCNLILVLVFDYEPLIQNHLIFTEDEIEEIEASGFDLRNFERIEVENE